MSLNYKMNYFIYYFFYMILCKNIGDLNKKKMGKVSVGIINRKIIIHNECKKTYLGRIKYFIINIGYSNIRMLTRKVDLNCKMCHQD